MKNNLSKKGLGIVGVTQVIFIILKLVGVINWSWLLVFTPTLVGFSLNVVGLVLIVCFIKSYSKKMFDDKKENRKAKVKEKRKNDTYSIQSMIIDGASKQDIIEMTESDEYKEAFNVKPNYDSEIKDFIDYINMNMTISAKERKKLLLKLKKAYLMSNKPTLNPIEYVEDISESHDKEKRLGTM